MVEYLHHNVGWVLELMYAGCDSSLMARVCWLPPLKWPAIPLDQAGVGLEEGLRRGEGGDWTVEGPGGTRWGTKGFSRGGSRGMSGPWKGGILHPTVLVVKYFLKG